MPPLRRGFAAALVLLAALAGRARAADEPTFTPEQLDALVAPVALYPDNLLAQVFIAATYPLEVVEADRWRQKNASLEKDGLEQALAGQDWDESVKWLTHFPDLLHRMSEELGWTQDMGDAFLAQRDGLMDAVQRMRAKAVDSGALKSNEQQVVVKEVVKEKETITIQPANPEVVYVPQYPPQAYGSSWAPPPGYYYPTYPAYPAYPTVGTTLLTFGAGMATGALIASAFDWNDHDVYVNNYYGGGGGGGKNNNSNNNINIDNSKTVNRASNRQKWEHNPEHRRSVRYRDEQSKDRYADRANQANRDRASKDVARGRTPQTDGGRQRPDGAQRPNTADRPGAAQRPAGGAQQRPGTGQAQQRPAGDARPGGADRGGAQQRPAQQARPADRQQNAFNGYGNGTQTREASARGAASRGTPSYAGAAPQRGGGQRAGGGGGRPGGGGGGGGGARGGGGGGRGGGGGGRGGRSR